MMRLLRSFFTAFSLYSAIPMPRTRWDSNGGMAYALCFFPLVGVLTGGLLFAWYRACIRFAVVPALFGAVAVLLPVMVSGGIHMDGFMDTVDALSSHAGTTKKLEILGDPHTGAFAILGCGGYLLLQFGLWLQIYGTPALVALPLLGFTLSRTYNALSIAAFPCARTSGLVYTFSSAASKRAVAAVCLGLICGVMIAGIRISPLWGFVMSGAAALCFALHRRLCMRGFGGNTGDLAGFLLQNIELACILTAALGGLLG